MNLTEYLEMTFNDCSNSCFLLDFHTETLVFLNQALEKKFHIFEEYAGKLPQQILSDYLDLHGLPDKNELKIAEYTEKRIFSPTLNTYLRSNSTLLEMNNKTYIVVKLFHTAKDEQRAEEKQSFDRAMNQCLEILSLPDKNTSIHAFLKLLGDFYACDLSYIYEFNRETNTLGSRYYWVAEDNNFQIPEKQDSVALHNFLEWLENDNDKKIVSVDVSTQELLEGTEESEIFQKYPNMNNITLSKLWNKDGSLMGIVGLSNRRKPLYDDRLLKVVSLFVVERFNEQSLVRAMETLSEIDLLTGFFNRSKYVEKLVELQENPPNQLGVLFVNLNGLRKTNEYLGFEMGDIQIKKTSATLRECYGNEFYRISGDEFVGFIEDCEKTIFEKKVEHLHSVLKAENHESTFSIGHGWDSGNYKVTELVKIADTVMMINKQAFYSSTFKENVDISNSLLQDLLQGIAEEEFIVYLQPQVRLKTEEVMGAEALIRRFEKKQQKMIFPDQFIPLYEKNSIIRHVDLFVIRRACQLLNEWRSYKKVLPISVNLSRVTLMEHGIVKIISDILDEYNTPHDLIIIEVTERIGLIENDVASSLVEEFKDCGFSLSLDDFGCAYSNIVTLSQISVDEVKIDKSLVDNLLTNEKNRVIVDSMVGMCNKFPATHTLAEGIETEEQAEFLRDVDCHLGQGYLYSRPVTSEEFTEKYISNGTETKVK